MDQPSAHKTVRVVTRYSTRLAGRGPARNDGGGTRRCVDGHGRDRVARGGGEKTSGGILRAAGRVGYHACCGRYRR